MKWILDKSRPLCPQISEQLCMKIAVGKLKPNEKLMSVREVALSAGVNPNTVQHSFEELERQSILYSVRGSGWYVAEDISAAKEVLYRLRIEKTAAYFEAMRVLGLEKDDVKKYIEEWDNE